MTLLDPVPDDTFTRARRRGWWRRLARRLRGKPTDLLDLDEVRARFGLHGQSHGGLRTIPIAKIVGSVDRTVDFDRDFGPQSRRSADRWRQLEHAFPHNDFPPISVYEIGGAYFVSDGHHRVALARHRGMEYIDATVTRIPSPVDLPVDADTCTVIHTQQQRRLLAQSGLEAARPRAEISFTRPEGYSQVLELIFAFGYRRSLQAERLLSRSEMAGTWWDEVYTRDVAAIHEEGLDEKFPYKTDGDLFLWVHQRHQALLPFEPEADVRDAARRRRDEGHPIGPWERHRRRAGRPPA